MKKTEEYATKQDLKTLKNEIVDEVGSLLSDAMTTMGGNFENVDKRFQNVDMNLQNIDKRFQKIDKNFQNIEDDLDELKLGQHRMERKLDATVERLDDHGKRIAKLEHKVA